MRLPTATVPLILDDHARARPVHRHLRIRLQHHHRNDDAERGTGEPAMLEQRREAIEEMNGLGPARNGQRGCIQLGRDGGQVLSVKHLEGDANATAG